MEGECGYFGKEEEFTLVWNEGKITLVWIEGGKEAHVRGKDALHVWREEGATQVWTKG